VTAGAFKHDVFISYAREDGEWVAPNLHERLLRCRTGAGERPSIYLDVGPEGLAPGENYLVALARAIGETRVFLPVYSLTYFRKPMCLWELTKAIQQDPMGGRMSPLLIDPAAAESVPAEANHINYIPTSRDDWFAIVCRRLELEPEEIPVELEFMDEPVDTFVNHTLAPVRVRVSAGGGRAPHEEEVKLSLKHGELSGTVAVASQDGIAEFRDLSVTTVAASTRLVAQAQGCEPALSEGFAVREDEATPAIGELAIAVADAEEAIFFDDGRALALVLPGRVVAYDLTGRELDGRVRRGRVRVVRSRGGTLALAEWSGDVHLLFSAGRPAETWRFGGEGRPAVPGDVAVLADHAYVGFWSGRVCKLVPGEDPHDELRHDAGVQALAVLGDLLCVCGLDGGLCFYRDGRIVRSHSLEPAIHLLKAYADCVVAVGDRKLYQVPLETKTVFDDTLPLGEPAGAFGGTDLPVVIDAQGKGIRFDHKLVIRRSFHTAAGALPVSADGEGRYCAFRNPDGSLSLMVEDRVALTHPAGTLAVSADGAHVALGDTAGIKMLTSDTLEKLVER
jgi:hypothetical protein